MEPHHVFAGSGLHVAHPVRLALVTSVDGCDDVIVFVISRRDLKDVVTSVCSWPVNLFCTHTHTRARTHTHTLHTQTTHRPCDKLTHPRFRMGGKRPGKTDPRMAVLFRKFRCQRHRLCPQGQSKVPAVDTP